MPTFVPPKINTAYTTYVSLISQANTRIFQANPTLAAGDVKVAIDDGAPANPGTLPVVDADFTKRVKVVLSAAEMNGDNITVIFSDAAGAEWCDLTVNIQTVARQVDDLAYPTTSGRALDVSAGGEAGLDWANIGSPTTTVNLSGTTVKTATDVAALLPAALVGGRMDSDIGAKTGNVALSAQEKLDVNAEVDNGFTTQMADSVPTDGTIPTREQAIYEIIQMLTEHILSGTTLTVRKVDGTTTLMTLTTDSATAPTSITRAT